MRWIARPLGRRAADADGNGYAVDGWMQTFDSISQRAEGFRGADHRGRYHVGLRSWSRLIPGNMDPNEMRCGMRYRDSARLNNRDIRHDEVTITALSKFLVL
ncbi:hypothetical protein MUK42_05200 [Musa troglodytarum]|uniref:Uncharacterized protein n=1 Tax=Musa troglodytarum TaxID=320322 RepID=A0A9E7EQG0_9LILI|nr:hypothetical protein MUK42_05200 [Musa troglodytarum]